MNTYKKYTVVFLGILLVLGYFLYKSNSQSAIKSELPRISPSPAVEQSPLLKDQEKSIFLLKQFMEYRSKMDASNVMALFTPPATKEDQKQYEFIMGMDLPDPSPRLYTTAGFGEKLQSWNVISSSSAERNFTFVIAEKRSAYDNTSGKTVVTSYTTVTEIEMVGSNSMIGKFYKKDHPSKYGGFD